ncbi:tail fiber assembly protein, partial [Pseudomonas auratipiscis]
SRLDAGLTVSKENEALTINGVTFDFSRLAEGSTLPADSVGSGFVIAPVERMSGRLVLTLMLPHAADASESVRFPVDIHDAADGPVHLPGLDIDPAQPIATNGVIDWSQVVTQEMKAQAAIDQHRALVVAEAAARRAVADSAIDPLQDAVDLDEATEAEAAELKAWKKYRIALIRVPDQPGYPDTIDWPAPPA